MLELTQRDAAFYAAPALLIGGTLLAQYLTTDTTPETTAWSVAALGSVLLVVRLLVGLARLLGVIGDEPVDGYREGREGSQ